MAHFSSCDLLEVGDLVKVNIPVECQIPGEDRFPHGEEVTIVRFQVFFVTMIKDDGLKPGVYENKAWAWVQLKDDSKRLISGLFLTNVDKREMAKRLHRLRRIVTHHEKKISELPEARFKRGERVKLLRKPPPGMPPEFRIRALEFRVIENGLIEPRYVVRYPSGGEITFTEGELARI